MAAPAFQVFQPRELTEEQKAILEEHKTRLEEQEARLEELEQEGRFWFSEVKKAQDGSGEEKKALHERRFLFFFARKERDNAQIQLDKLRIEFGQVPGSGTDYIDVSKEVALELVGEPFSALPALDKLTERLEREVPCCFPEEAAFVYCCREQYRAQRETEINNDPSSFLFVKASPNRRMNPSTLSIRSVVVDARSVIEHKSVNAIHAVLRPLTQFFLGDLLKLLDFSWFSPTESFARNEAEPKRTRTTAENLRPDWMFSIYNLLVVRGEEKGSISNARIAEVAEELRQTLDTWHPLFFGELPYVFGYACSGTRFQFYALHPDHSIRFPGGASGVQLKRIGKELNLAYLDERFHLLKYIINLVRVLEAMEPLIPINAPPIGRVPVPSKRPHSGEYSTIVFEPGYVIKTLNETPTGYVRYDFPMLEELYEVIKAEKIRFSIRCNLGYPEKCEGLMRLHLYPIGFPVIPKDEATLKTCLSNVLVALEDLHGQRFCHRDVRWPNILKNIDHSWMLIDFDFAARLISGKAEWPTWTRGVPLRVGSESWSTKHDIMQVAMLLDDEDLKWFEKRDELAKRIKGCTKASDAQKTLVSFFKD